MLRIARVPMLAGACLLAGCGVGYDQTLFVTTTNVGLNIDTKPPTAEISIARREGVIAPTFEGGEHPPVYARFRSDTEGLIPLDTKVSALFAGGRAAALATAGNGDGANGHPGTLCLKSKPTETDLPGEGDVRPMFFGTDTTLGLKVGWSGITGVYPDTIKLGFNRKEFALAPVFGDADGCPDPRLYGVRMPSFIASVNSGVKAGELSTPDQDKESNVTYQQFFATGESADNLAKDPVVRKEFRAITYSASDLDANATLIGCWASKSNKNRNDLTKYLQDTHNIHYGVDFLLNKKFETKRKNAVSHFNMTC